MAIHVTSVNGMGASVLSGSTITNTGMRAEDHMHLSEFLIRQSGVENVASDYRVTQNGTPNLSVNVAAGRAFVLNSSWSANSTSQQKYYHVVNDGVINVAINNNTSGNPRITSIFLKVDAGATPNDNATNVAEIVAIDGTPSGAPVAPATPNNHIRLADITVANGASSITNANISDSRVTAFPAGTLDGWLPAPAGTYTRASATTITVPAGLNATLIFSKGDMLQYTESVTGTTKYAYIVGVSSTTLTITSGTDFGGGIAAANNPEDILYSHGSSAVGFPGAFAFDVGYNGLSANPVTTAYFTINGTHITIYIRGATFGTSNSNILEITGMPVSSANRAGLTWTSGMIQASNVGGNEMTAQMTINPSANTIVCTINGSAAGWSSSGNQRIVYGSLTYEF